ncbi:LexA family transcriptional regulator [Acinetobacter sp. B51(2017)]|uniref:helix-turn-helix domain-containing protein n=1 Tax=Acinetobacter sp. B51(2017) TaxID=2060938 RepID=UPI000F084430|nr:LexA family transcriptional regulator [Acinetobacter sp. B51(2017)]
MDHLGTRLKQLRKNKNITQQQLAELIGVSKTSIIYWEKGDNLPKHDSLITLGKVLGVSPTYLMQGKTTDNLEENSSYVVPNRFIPLLSWQQANQKDSLKNIDANHKNWLAAHPNMTKDCYALEVLGESMLPEFRPHDYLYVTTDLESVSLRTGDFVIVQTQDHQDALFKRLVIETEGMFLQVLNEKWPQPIIPLTASFKIVAKVVGFWRDLSNSNIS